MNFDDFIQRLQDDQDYSHLLQGLQGVLVANNRFKTECMVSLKAIEDYTWEQMTSVFKAGKDIDHITRVTGYFSKTSQWNDGKLQELKDRARLGQEQVMINVEQKKKKDVVQPVENPQLDSFDDSNVSC